MDNGRIDDRAGRDADALRLQMQVHRIQDRAAEIVLLKQVTEPQHRRFIRRRSHAEVHASETAQRNGAAKRTHRTPPPRPGPTS